jgi:RNA polymerase sigma factor (sigma-70 family)
MAPRDTRFDFEGLYRSHRNEVYRAALRKLGDHHEAEDVTQAAFLDAYRAVLRGSHPDLPRAWLLAIAENVRRRRFRTSLRRPREEPLRESLPSAEPPWRAQIEEIRAALATLPENQRKAFLLRELGGFSYVEIGAQLDLSVPAVQMLLFRARQKLRGELAPTGSLRIGGIIPVPHWLLGLADRIPAGFAGPRVAGFVAAGVIATSVGVVSDVSVAEPKWQPAGDTPLVVANPASLHVTAPVLRASHAPLRRPLVGSVVAKRAIPVTRANPRPGEANPTTSVVPVVEVVEGGGAEPAAPVAPPATLGIDDGAPAPALIPALPPVSQAPIVPVVTKHLPPLPEPPVDVVVPALPDLPIVQPPLPPALPGGVEVTIPEVVSLRVGP